MGLDHGLKRIGVAISDASRLIATELAIVVRKTRAEDFAALNALAAREQVTGFVIGIPYSQASQGAHTQADTVALWISRFAQTTPLPIATWDETLTSDDARLLARRLRRRPDAPIDDLAARVMLQSFLDALRDGLATFPPRSSQTDLNSADNPL
jgi:putative Holliday junction resolvase